MILTRIWERYLFREIFKFFIYFLASFYFLYVVVDYSIHMQDFFQNNHIDFGKIFLYYSLQLIKRADILLPLALLFSTIKVLCQLNVNHELLAFQSAGLSLKRKLLRPLFFIAILCCGSNLVINEYAIPYSLNFIDKFYDAYFRHSFHGNRSEPLHIVHLNDHSKLIYQYYDGAKKAFFDVIWVRNPEDLWRMKYLKADPDYPQGEFVDHLMHNENGGFEKIQSFDTLLFQDLAWNKELPRKGYIPYENRSITELWSLTKQHTPLSNYEKQEIMTQLLFKIVMPLLSILIIIAVIPYCLRIYKNLSQFFIYCFGLFSFVGFIALMDAAVILGENSTFPPVFAILSPFICFFLIFGWRFARCR